MNRVAQWVIDVGLLHERDVRAGRWWKIRLRFWHTATNRIHRTYREVITVLAEAADRDIEAAYVRGSQDGALQLAETLHEEQTQVSCKTYYRH